MASDVICVSSNDGAEAFSTATEVAEQLGWRLVDEDIVSRAAVEAGVHRDVVADVERRKSVVERLLENLSTAGASMAYAPTLAEALSTPRSDDLRGLIRSVIEEVADQGRAVIVAHAASLALREREGVLRVMITASPQTRARRIASTLEVDESEATRMLERSEAGRADYVKRFYGVAQESPEHYDLVINTDRLTASQAAALILHAAGERSGPRSTQ
jgi:cytidylate kinase